MSTQPANRYSRQVRVAGVGDSGQARLANATVLIVGCGALGTHLADTLARAGVGHLHLCDRDIVEWSNLQRQVLFTEQDAAEGLPNAVAARDRRHGARYPNNERINEIALEPPARRRVQKPLRAPVRRPPHSDPAKAFQFAPPLIHSMTADNYVATTRLGISSDCLKVP